MKTLKILSILMFFLAYTINSEAQIINPKKALGNKVVNRVNNNINKGLDKGLDMLEKGTKETAKKVVEGDESTEKKDDSNNQTEDQNKEDEPAKPNNESNARKSDEPSLQSYSKYDFIPGEKVIFFDDFSQDAVGDFPALWNTNGSAEVVTTNLHPGNWMKFVMNQCVWTDELLTLPENYTIEFDVIPIGGLEGASMSGYNFRLMQAKNVKGWDAGSAPGKGGFNYKMEYYGRPDYHTWFGPGKEDCSQGKISGYRDDENVKQKLNNKYHIAIWVQKTRIRFYQNETKVFDLPKAFPTGCVSPDRIRFENGAAMITNVRIAVGAPDTRSKLITEGKLVSYGIYFDVNKDIVKPESYGTLKSIADVLKENPAVKIKIVGHTDADGADGANLDLSKRRGASVKNELVKTFGIDASRIETDGMGESQPVAPNDTPANKALNRRVEFIKL